MLGARASALLEDKSPIVVPPPSDWVEVPGFGFDETNWSLYRGSSTNVLTAPAAGTWQWQSTAGGQILAWSKTNWTLGDFKLEWVGRVVANPGGDAALFMSVYWGVVGDGTAGFPGDVSQWPVQAATPNLANFTITASQIADHARGYRVGHMQTVTAPTLPVAAVDLRKFNLTTAEPALTGWSPGASWAHTIGVDYLCTLIRKGGTLTFTQKDMGSGVERVETITDAGLLTWSDGRFGFRLGNTRTVRLSACKVYKAGTAPPPVVPDYPEPLDLPTGLTLQAPFSTAPANGAVVDNAGKYWETRPTLPDDSSVRYNSPSNFTVKNTVYRDTAQWQAVSWPRRKYVKVWPETKSDNNGIFINNMDGPVTIDGGHFVAFDGIRCTYTEVQQTLTVKNAYANGRDEAYEGDGLHNNQWDNCLLEGGHVLSMRPGSESNNRRATFCHMTNCLLGCILRLDPDVERIEAVGEKAAYITDDQKTTAWIFKLNTEVPYDFKFTDCIFHSPLPGRDGWNPMFWPAGTYTRCIFVWSSSVPYQGGPLPAGLTFTTDVNVWKSRRNAWVEANRKPAPPPPLTHAEKAVQLAKAVCPGYDHMSPGWCDPSYSNYNVAITVSGRSPPDKFTLHSGQDIGGIEPTPVLIGVPGTIVDINGVAVPTTKTEAGDAMVLVKGDDGIWWPYGHINRTAGLAIGQRVETGFQIGTIAGDFTAWSEHVHIGALKYDPASTALVPGYATKRVRDGMGWGIIYGDTQAEALDLAQKLTWDPVEAWHNWLNR